MRVQCYQATPYRNCPTELNLSAPRFGDVIEEKPATAQHSDSVTLDNKELDRSQSSPEVRSALALVSRTFGLQLTGSGSDNDETKQSGTHRDSLQSSDLAQSALTTSPLGVTQIKESGIHSPSAQALTPPEVLSTESQSSPTHTNLNSQVPMPISKADSSLPTVSSPHSDGVSQPNLPSDGNYVTWSVSAVSKGQVEDVKSGSVPGPTPSPNPAACANACSIEPFQPKPRDLTVTATLNGQDIKMLVDTGAGMSVVDKRFLRALYKGTLPELHGSSLSSVKTVSSEALLVLKKLQVVLQIAGGNYVCNLQVVKDLTYEAVLGRDFLRANGAVINLRNGTLQLEDNHMQPHPARACSVHMLSTCVIPPSSEAMIPARLDQDTPAGDAGLIEASENLKVCYQLQGAAALVTVTADQPVPFRLINPTTKPVTLYKGATLGTFTSVNDNLQVFSLDTA